MTTTVDLASNMAQSMQGLSDLVEVLAYIGGIAFAIKGAISFKEYNDLNDLNDLNETQEAMPLIKPLTMMIVSGMLLAMPTFLSTAQITISGRNPQAVARAIVPATDRSVVASAIRSTPVATAATAAPKVEAVASTQSATTTRDPASSDLLTMMEALGGLGLLGLGGWGMLRQSARKSESQREAQIEEGLLRSQSFFEARQ